MTQFIARSSRAASGFVSRFTHNLQVANTRRALQNLDDKTLSDIGICRAQINDYVQDIYREVA